MPFLITYVIFADIQWANRVARSCYDGKSPRPVIPFEEQVRYL
jgi:hypothetical protein